MSEKELRNALLNLDSARFSGVPDVQQQTWNILERDRQRVKFMTRTTIAVWLAAVLTIFGVLVYFGLLFPFEAKVLQEMVEGKLVGAERDRMLHHVLASAQIGTLMVAFAVALHTLASLSTVVLLFASRRATLRQVNASLMEIAVQLRGLRPGV